MPLCYVTGMFVPGRRRGAFERLSQKTCLCITHKKASPDLGGCSFNHSRNLWNLLLYPSGYSFLLPNSLVPPISCCSARDTGPFCRSCVILEQPAGRKGRIISWVILCVLPAGTREAHGLNPAQGWAMCFLLYRSARRKGDYQDREIVFGKFSCLPLAF